LVSFVDYASLCKAYRITHFKILLKTSLEKDYQEPKPDKGYTSLLEVLNNTPTKTESPPNAIVHNGGKGPFGHISYPVGGFKPYSSRAQI
jgi:hypothetical protein